MSKREDSPGRGGASDRLGDPDGVRDRRGRLEKATPMSDRVVPMIHVPDVRATVTFHVENGGIAGLTFRHGGTTIRMARTEAVRRPQDDS